MRRQLLVVRVDHEISTVASLFFSGHPFTCHSPCCSYSFRLTAFGSAGRWRSGHFV